MTDFELLTHALSAFAGLSVEDIQLAEQYWQYHTYKKGDFYNKHRSVCRYLGFTLEGVFRSYIIDEKTAEEKNVFLYSSNQFVVTFKSFINQVPCNYHTVAMADASVLCIGIEDLHGLYKMSHGWERFGRLLAQEAFNVVIERNESIMFKTPEERYLDLLQQHPDVFNHLPLYHIASYLGIQGPSLSRIRKRLSGK